MKSPVEFKQSSMGSIHNFIDIPFSKKEHNYLHRLMKENLTNFNPFLSTKAKIFKEGDRELISVPL